jgi:hypothetical protein
LLEITFAQTASPGFQPVLNLDRPGQIQRPQTPTRNDIIKFGPHYGGQSGDEAR